MLTKADFEKTVRDYAIYKLSLETVKVPS
jgi:hypothetical protein